MKTPTTKQAEVLRHYANCMSDEQLVQQRRFLGGYHLDEATVAEWLDVSEQAAIALLSSMIRAGWLQSTQRKSGVWWGISPSGEELLPLFADGEAAEWLF